MNDQTNIALVLKEVFQKISSKMPSSQGSGLNLLGVWSSLLGGNGRNEYDVVASINQILKVFQRLQTQITLSTKLDDVTRQSARETISNFSNFFSFSRLNVDAFSLKPHCTTGLVGQLAMIGYSLQSEFPEPKMSRGDIDDIQKKLNEIRDVLNEKGLPIDLRIALAKYVDTMIFWLDNSEIMSAQELFEQMASSVVVATQMEGCIPDENDDEKTKAKKITGVLKDVFGCVAKVVGVVVKYADNIEKLEHTGKRLLDSISSSS